MPASTLTLEYAKRLISVLEKHLAAGYLPPGLARTGIISAVRMAANELKMHFNVASDRLGTPTRAGSIERRYGIKPNWSKYKPPPLPEHDDAPSAPYISPTDRKYTLLQDENRELRKQLKEAHRASEVEQLLRELIGRVVDTPRETPKWLTQPAKRDRNKNTPEVPIMIWSDWHVGEVVQKDEVNGFNQYDMATAEARVQRLIESTLTLCRDNHTGVYPGAVINLLGDFVSGGLHAELRATDEEEPIPACLKTIDWLVEGIKRCADYFGKIYIAGACGNHGRTTVKPEFKRYYRKNFDWLILQMLMRHFQDDKRIQFDVRPSNDVHYRVYGERYLVCHGDMLGVRGGDGIIGSIGPIVRGEIKQAGQSSGLGLTFDRLVVGHWHQRLWLPRAIVNNSLKGFDEFCMKALGAKPDRPTQTMWFMHPRHGITAHWDIYVDDKPETHAEWVSWRE
jgi:hypothetical protein